MEDNNLDNLENELLERREYRRKRRVRNQSIAYSVTAVLFIIVIIGAVFGVKSLSKAINREKTAEEQETEQANNPEQAEDTVTIEPPETYEEPNEAEAKSPLDIVVDTCISELPLEDKVAGLFIITPEALTNTDKAIKAGDKTKEKLQEYAVGGLIYFKQNIQSREQLTQLLTNTKNMSKYPLFLSVDEEGGKVARVAESKLGENVGSMQAIGETQDAGKAYEAGVTIGTYLSELEFNLNLAPVADVLSDAGNSVIGDRSFGSDAEMAGNMVASYVNGLEGTGVSACLKHFPGLGMAEEDTHEGMAATERTLDDMRGSEFVAFKAGIDAGADFVMVSHLSAPNVLEDNTPSSLSSVMITDVLRNELGFGGIIITDALNMAAITDYYTSEEACVKALLAGADMLLMPENFEEAYQGVLTAVRGGTLSEERIDESLRRIYRVKYADQVQ